jgi:hypothetical protein
MKYEKIKQESKFENLKLWFAESINCGKRHKKYLF